MIAERLRSPLEVGHLLTLTQEKRKDVISKCVISEPKHGEVWQSIAKDPQNAEKGVEEILKMVIEKLE